MRTEIDTYSKIAKELKVDYPKLSDFELLSLAIQIERNQLLENGLNISRSDNYPASLEAIAIALGYTKEQFQQTITDVLKSKE
jgi:hypothetical protein